MRRDRPWWQRWLDRLQQRLFPAPVPIRQDVKKCLSLFVLVGVLGLTAPAAMAQPPGRETAEAQDKIAYNKVRGEVTYVGKRAISVEFDRTADSSTEMLLPLGDETALKRLRTLEDLKRGDTVHVAYQQVYREDEKGKRIVLKTTATEIALMRSAPRQELGSREAPPEETP